MFVVLPVLCFCGIALAVYQAANRPDRLPSWRRSFLLACVIWGVVLLAITEVLSAFTILTFGWLLALWALGCLAALALNLWLRRGKLFPGMLPTFAGGKTPRIPLFLTVLLSGVAAIVAVVGLIALIAPPNTWDSMTYHMPRVMHWIQDQGIAFYPTNSIRQLHQPPWAEYVILHLQLLSGGDYFANGVQWFSMIGSIIGASLIAGQLGADLRGQIFAAVIVATIPMGILQASGTQNDYVVSFWLICSISFLLAYKAQPNRIDALAAGASLGLALLTKGTAYVYAFPFLLWFGLWGIRTLRWHIWRPALLVLVPALCLNLTFYARNIAAFGNPLGPGDTTALYSNGSFSPTTLISNVLRNLSLELGTPSSRINNLLNRGFSKLFIILGININDPQTTWHGTIFQINGANNTWNQEITASNTLHFFLILLVILLCLWLKRLRTQKPLLLYLAALIGAFLLFSLYLKWQPWDNRLLLPLFVLFAPLCGVVLAHIPQVKLANALLLLLLLAALPWVLDNQSRPLLGSQNIFTAPRVDQYFVNRPTLEAPYLDTAHFIQSTSCSTIGFYAAGLDGWGYPIGLDAWEYPLWVLLNPSGNGNIRIEHVLIHNSSAPLAQEAPFASFHPCAIIAERFLSDQGSALSSNGELYTRAWSSGPIDQTFTIAVFMQTPGPTSASVAVSAASPTTRAAPPPVHYPYESRAGASSIWPHEIKAGAPWAFSLPLFPLALRLRARQLGKKRRRSGRTAAFL